MLILSNFKDYYDCISSHGVEREIKYNRITAKINLIENLTLIKELEEVVSFLLKDFKNNFAFNKGCFLAYKKKKIIRVELGIIGFCGKIFPFFISGDEWTSNYRRWEDLYFKYGDLVKNKNKTKRESYFGLTVFDREIASRYEQNCLKTKIDLQFFHYLNTPIFIFVPDYCNFNETILTVNTNLAKYHFQHWFNPYAAYQEIRMFVSGVLQQPSNKTIEITDEKVLLTLHGMGKMSFKQGKPGAKKQRRKANKLFKQNKNKSKGKNNI